MPYSTYYDATPLNTASSDPAMYRWQPSTTTAAATTTPSATATIKNHIKNESLSDRLAYVEALVDMNAMVIEAIWPMPSPSSNIVPLRCFIQEVLKRSRTTYSTLQTAFFYLFRARPAIVHFLHISSTKHHQHKEKEQVKEEEQEATTEENKKVPLSGRDAYIHCGRRMFLASLVVASKFVQDKTYRNSAWAKIAGLPVQEINASERVFLGLLDYRLYVAQATFDQWHQLLHAHVQAKTSQKFSSSSTKQQQLFDPSSSSSSSSPTSSPSLASASTTRTIAAALSSSSSCSSLSSSQPISILSPSCSLPLPSPSASPSPKSLSPLRPIASSSSSSSTSTLTLPSLRPNIIPSSATLPALSPSSIASTSSLNCSPILMHTPPSINSIQLGKRHRLLNEQDSFYQQRKRPCSAWSSSS